MAKLEKSTLTVMPIDFNRRLDLMKPSIKNQTDIGHEKGRSRSWCSNPLRHEFMGACFDPLTKSQTLEKVKSVTDKTPFCYIVTPNVDHLVRLNKKPETYKPLYDPAWLSVCDSRILELLASFSGLPLKAVPGSDLTALLIETVLGPDDIINVIGADTDIIITLKQKYPYLNINHHEPPMGLRKNAKAVAACAEFIARHPARYSFLCVGSPQQEMVARACEQRGDCTGLGLCVGASLDFLAGKAKRAPLWIQKLRMEWLFRLVSEPRRLWKRYLIEGPKIFMIWLRWTMSRKNA